MPTKVTFEMARAAKPEVRTIIESLLYKGAIRDIGATEQDGEYGVIVHLKSELPTDIQLPSSTSTGVPIWIGNPVPQVDAR